MVNFRKVISRVFKIDFVVPLMFQILESIKTKVENNFVCLVFLSYFFRFSQKKGDLSNLDIFCDF